MDDNCDKNVLADKELFWIKLLNSSYLLGFNDNIKGYGNISDVSNLLLFRSNHPYYALSVTKFRDRSSKRNKNRVYNSINDLTNKINEIVGDMDLYRYLKSLNKPTISNLISHCYNNEYLDQFSGDKRKVLLSLLCVFQLNLHKTKSTIKDKNKFGEVKVKVNLNKTLNNYIIKDIVGHDRILPCKII